MKHPLGLMGDWRGSVGFEHGFRTTESLAVCVVGGVVSNSMRR